MKTRNVTKYDSSFGNISARYFGHDQLPSRVHNTHDNTMSVRTPSVQLLKFILVASHLNWLFFCVLNLFLPRTQPPFNVS